MVAEANGFMNSLVVVESDIAVEREDASAKTMLVDGATAAKSSATVYLNGTRASAAGSKRPVKELCRLWKYRNGMSPIDLDE